MSFGNLQLKFDNLGLENCIINMEALYAPDKNKALKNIANTGQENLKYLGSYFPRSYMEAKYIWKSLININSIKQSLEDNSKINILVIGSGTGGDLIGLMEILNANFSNKTFTFYSIEGNKDASNIQKQLFDHRDKYITEKNTFKLLNYNKCPINASDFVKEINKLVDSLEDVKFDIIQTFKFCNELDAQGNLNIYYKMCTIAEQYLKENGLLLIEEVTCKYEDPNNPNQKFPYFPVMMIKQIRDYFKSEETGLNWILPLPCGQWAPNCTPNGCYPQISMSLITNIPDNQGGKSHNDPMNFAYILIIKGSLGKDVKSQLKNNSTYILSEKHNKSINYCNYCENGLYKSERDSIPNIPHGIFAYDLN